MTEVIGTGKNVEKAIEDAIIQLKTSRDNVDIKILETGGLFKKARVQVSISEDFLQEYNKNKKQKEKILREENSKDKKQCSEKEDKTQLKTIYEKMLKEEKPKESVNVLGVKSNEEKNKEKIKPAVETEKNEIEKKTEVKKDSKKADKADVKKEEKIKENLKEESEVEIGKVFLESFLKLASINAVVDIFEDDDEIFYTVLGEEATSLIGYRGAGLNSLQFLVSVLNGKNNRKNKRVRLDIDGYREKRKGTLEMLARRVAKKVQKTGKQTRLEPMSAYERRIIHTTVQEFEDVASVSRGEEPHRYLIIRKKEKKEENASNKNSDSKNSENSEI